MENQNENFVIKKHEHFIEIIVSEYVDLNQGVADGPTLYSICSSTKLYQILIDLRKATGNPTPDNKQEYTRIRGEHYKNYIKDGGNPLKAAYLYDPNSLGSLTPIIETIRQNGNPAEFFTDREEALTWLGKKALSR